MMSKDKNAVPDKSSGEGVLNEPAGGKGTGITRRDFLATTTTIGAALVVGCLLNGKIAVLRASAATK